MGMPGIGSMVVYHYAHGGGSIDVPAIVVCTHDAWTGNPGYGDQYPDPTPSQVILMAILAGDMLAQQTASEGTGPGEFSRISLGLDLGVISLGSADLSAQVATDVVVPDV